MPAIGKAREKAKIVQTRGQINALLMAIKMYESTYGYLPFGVGINSQLDYFTEDDKPDQSEKWNKFDEDDDKDYVRLIGYLTCVGIDPTDPSKDLKNPRGIQMLENFKTFEDSGKTYPTFLDPWGRRFRIAWDLESSSAYDGKISGSAVDGISAGTIYSSIVIYSAGKDGKTENDNTSSDYPDNIDNIYSMDTTCNRNKDKFDGHHIQ
jgi:hypothetical protein